MHYLSAQGEGSNRLHQVHLLPTTYVRATTCAKATMCARATMCKVGSSSGLVTDWHTAAALTGTQWVSAQAPSQCSRVGVLQENQLISHDHCSAFSTGVQIPHCVPRLHLKD